MNLSPDNALMRQLRPATIIMLLLLIAFNTRLAAQSPGEVFWQKLKEHCGRAYEGRMPEGASTKDFEGKRLIMHVRSCEDGEIRIPFFVENDRSRTWVFTFEDGRIKLKHDHRHEDGKPDTITQYGGTAANHGSASMQIFPADQETAQLIDYAIGNVWWVTLNETEFSYNLRRVGSDRLVSVVFDLSKAISVPPAPWGWKD